MGPPFIAENVEIAWAPRWQARSAPKIHGTIAKGGDFPLLMNYPNPTHWPALNEPNGIFKQKHIYIYIYIHVYIYIYAKREGGRA